MPQCELSRSQISTHTATCLLYTLYLCTSVVMNSYGDGFSCGCYSRSSCTVVVLALEQGYSCGHCFSVVYSATRPRASALLVPLEKSDT